MPVFPAISERQSSNFHTGVIAKVTAEQVGTEVAGHLETLIEHGLPDDSFSTYIARIEAVSTDNLLRVAKKHLDPSHLAIIIVGDREKVEMSLRQSPVGKDLEVVRFDESFHLAPVK